MNGLIPEGCIRNWQWQLPKSSTRKLTTRLVKAHFVAIDFGFVPLRLSNLSLPPSHDGGFCYLTRPIQPEGCYPGVLYLSSINWYNYYGCYSSLNRRAHQMAVKRRLSPIRTLLFQFPVPARLAVSWQRFQALATVAERETLCANSKIHPSIILRLLLLDKTTDDGNGSFYVTRKAFTRLRIF